MEEGVPQAGYYGTTTTSTTTGYTGGVNPFAGTAQEEGNPFDDIPDVEESAAYKQKYGTLHDYSDGGSYEDDYGPDPYKDYGAQVSQQPTYQPQPPQQQHQFSPVEERFPGEEPRLEHVEIDVESGPSENQPQEEEEDPKNLHVWNIAYYSDYFNVDTAKVSTRILRAVVPFSTKFFASIEENPDLYGPFWVATTLIFVMAAAGNFAAWIHDENNFHYDFSEVTFGAMAIYGYIVVIPIALWFVCHWLKIPLKLLQILCIYGYSLFIFIPTAVVCILPYWWLRWTLIGAATADSLLFLVMNFVPPILNNNLEASKKVVGTLSIIGALSLLHIALGLTFLFYFFNYAT